MEVWRVRGTIIRVEWAEFQITSYPFWLKCIPVVLCLVLILMENLVPADFCARPLAVESAVHALILARQKVTSGPRVAPPCATRSNAPRRRRQATLPKLYAATQGVRVVAVHDKPCQTSDSAVKSEVELPNSTFHDDTIAHSLQQLDGCSVGMSSSASSALGVLATAPLAPHSSSTDSSCLSYQPRVLSETCSSSNCFLSPADACVVSAASHSAWMTMRPFVSMVRFGVTFQRAFAFGRQFKHALDNDTILEDALLHPDGITPISPPATSWGPLFCDDSRPAPQQPKQECKQQ